MLDVQHVHLDGAIAEDGDALDGSPPTLILRQRSNLVGGHARHVRLTPLLSFAAGRRRASADVDDGSTSVATCGAGALNWGAYGTGARPLFIPTAAVALTTGRLAGSGDLTVAVFGVDGCAKIAALAVPRKHKEGEC